MNKNSLNNLCTPAKFYLLLSLIGVMLYGFKLMKKRNNLGYLDIVTNIIAIIVWTAILNWICTKKYGESIAWILVFLPMILLILFTIIILIFIKKTNINKDKLDELLDEDCKKCNV